MKIGKMQRSILKVKNGNKYIINFFNNSFEKLTGDLSGLYSRRINRQHRIIYEVTKLKKEIHILRMWTHYE